MSSDEKSGDEEPGSERSAGASAEDLDQLARQYLDLWQDQLTALSANPAISEAMAGFFAKWSPAAAPATANRKDGEADARRADARRANASGLDDGEPSTGAAPAGSSSVSGGDRVGELLERLDRIEKRLARLERQGS